MREKVLEKAIQEFNATRAPEAWAKLIKFDPSSFSVEFGGTACSACGFEEHFTDLQIQLKQSLNKRYRVSKIERPKVDQYLVTYHLEGKK